MQCTETERSHQVGIIHPHLILLVPVGKYSQTVLLVPNSP